MINNTELQEYLLTTTSMKISYSTDINEKTDYSSA